MKPICVQCQRFYRCKKNGVYFVESAPKGGVRPLPGKVEPESWKPYKVWSGDLWRCPDCGHELISGVGFSAVYEQYMPDFASGIEQLGANWLHVKDC